MTNKEIIQYTSTSVLFTQVKPLFVYVLMVLLSIVGLYRNYALLWLCWGMIGGCGW